jgi:hypothetical protein
MHITADVRGGQPFRLVASALIAAMFAAFAVACGSTSVSELTSPSGERCQATLSPSAQSLPATGGAITVGVATTRDCSWTATSDASWIRLSPSSGQGEATVTANVDANPQIVARSGNISVNGQRVSLTQDARACTFDIASNTTQFGGTGGTGRVDVTTITGCTWTATTNADWIHVTGGSHTGNGSLTFQVDANDAGAREGIITIGGRNLLVMQGAAATPAPPSQPPAPACTYSLTPASHSLPAAGGTDQFQVMTQAGCAWTASKDAQWIALTTMAGTGSGTVGYTAQANPTTTQRSATITVGDQMFTLTQAAAACTFTLAPASADFAPEGGSGRLTVTTSSNCGWTAAAGAPWVTVSNRSGTGSGDVNFSVQANPASIARSTTITIGGQSFTVNQTGVACTYAIDPTSLNLAASGGEGRFTLTTQAGCAWTAVAAAMWVTVSTPSGTGSSVVVYTAAANSDPAARSTTITAGGQVHTVNQAGAPAPCTYSLDPTSASYMAPGGSATFKVMTQPGCTWTASTMAPWITVTSGAGNGTGDVAYSVQVNSTGAARSDTITVAGQVFTVSQEP